MALDPVSPHDAVPGLSRGHNQHAATIASVLDVRDPEDAGFEAAPRTGGDSRRRLACWAKLCR